MEKNNQENLTTPSPNPSPEGRGGVVLYCSLDIETSGFDPAKDEILELGFVFFELGAKGIKLGKEYSQVFKPKGEVTETILALTGITRAELEKGKDFTECKEEIQEQLKDAVIVGHNIKFDVKFLESLGIKFEGTFVDTLDLAQFILPTHPSYNLENLMHYFGVPHTEAHRALADAKATLLVLEGLINAFDGFPNSLKTEIKEIAESVKFPWAPILEAKMRTPLVGRIKKPSKPAPEGLCPAKLEVNKFYNFSLGANIPLSVAHSISQQKQPSLLVLPNFSQVMKLWKAGLAEPAFASSDQFDGKAFKALRLKPNLSADELKFILKILVWQETNWQSENISDLNLSFFGGQFKSLIIGKSVKERSRETVLACDLASFFEFVQKGWYKSRKIIFVGLDSLEKALSDNLGEKTGWGRFNYLLKGIYNPETGIGDSSLSKEVEDGLRACDLFFGLTSALLQSDPPGFLQIKFASGVLPEETIDKITSSAKNFVEKLGELNKKIKSDDIANALAKLKGFFEVSENRVKWLELSANSCSFHSSPVKINELAQKLFNFGQGTVLCDCLPKAKVWEYFQSRLGAESFIAEAVAFERPNKKLDLFSFKSSKISVNVKKEDLAEADILGFCAKNNLPAAILMGNAGSAKDFYHKHHALLQSQAFVLAQMGSGSSRLLRNFSIHKETLLLAAGRFILKSLSGQGAGANLGGLEVKTLVIASLPFDQFKHPYLEAVSKEFNNPFEDFSLPKAVLNLHQIIEFFFSAKLKMLVIADSKLAKPYGKVFLEYFDTLVDR